MARVLELTLEETLERASLASPSDSSANNEYEDGWGGATLAGALDLAINGYPEGADTLKHAMGVLATIRTTMRPSPRWGPSGSSVDLGRYLAGEPDNMVEVVRAIRPSPVLKIGIERAVSHRVPKEDIEATGASVLTAVEALRSAGVPSEVWATFTVMSKHTGNVMTTRVLIQETGRPLDIDRLAFWVVHPAALRRVMFSVWEHEKPEVRDEFGYRRDGGYGMPTWFAGTTDFDEVAPANAAEATEWLRKVLLRRLGVEIRSKEADR